MIISGEQFGRFFREFTTSATRIETLPVYTVDEEAENFQAYLSGKPLAPERNEQWAANIRACVDAGKYMGRVHIIDHLLTSYLRFEIDWYYAINGPAGEDIRFIFREDVPDLVYADTWIFDEQTVIDLTYGSDGRLLRIEQTEESERLEEATHAWREFHKRSFPLSELMAGIRTTDLRLS